MPRLGQHLKPRSATAPPAVPGARWLPLTRGRFALLDEADFDRLSRFAWTYSERHGYAFRKAPKGTHSAAHLRLHREVLEITDPTITVDHRHGDRLDCRRSELRVATSAQNARNNRGKAGRTTAPFKGVYPTGRPAKPWAAKITVNRRTLNLGRFATAEEAARAYDEAARLHFGEFARPTFPVGAGRGELRASEELVG